MVTFFSCEAISFESYDSEGSSECHDSCVFESPMLTAAKAISVMKSHAKEGILTVEKDESRVTFKMEVELDDESELLFLHSCLPLKNSNKLDDLV